MRQLLLLLVVIFLISGCAGIQIPTTSGDPENANTYGYHPIDPLPVEIKLEGQAKLTNKHLLNALPDETMRIAIGEFNSKGGLTFGTASTGVEGNNYIVVLDYIKFSTNPLPVVLQKEQKNNMTTTKAFLTEDLNQANVIVPTYIGIGLRMTANIKVLKGDVDLGSLYALGAAAEAKQISGSLVIQTLGISGESISSIMPMPSEISSSTIQNAILALGTMKAKMYESDTWITPRVVGVYNNLGGGAETINGFISSMLQKPQILKVDNSGS